MSRENQNFPRFSTSLRLNEAALKFFNALLFLRRAKRQQIPDTQVFMTQVEPSENVLENVRHIEITPEFIDGANHVATACMMDLANQEGGIDVAQQVYKAVYPNQQNESESS